MRYLFLLSSLFLLMITLSGAGGDNITEVAQESGPALAQDDIDSLFTAVRSGQD